MNDTPEAVFTDIARCLHERAVGFALVGGLGVSIRAEVRFTRDIDLAVAVADDAAVDTLVHALRGHGYTPVALVEHATQRRVATVRLQSASGVAVDLLTASSGIEADIVARATAVPVPGVGSVPVASPEDLLALKILAMTDRRLQDRIDAISLVLTNPDLDLDAVRAHLRCITERGYHRDQDLLEKLASLLRDATRISE
jgi:predicted nucleotidyltransferase